MSSWCVDSKLLFLPLSARQCSVHSAEFVLFTSTGILSSSWYFYNSSKVTYVYNLALGTLQ